MQTKTAAMAKTTRKHGAKRGDLIEIFCGIHELWALYVGKDEVVCLTQKDDKIIVKCDNIWKVVGKHSFKVNNLLDEKYKPREIKAIVEDARKMVGQKWSSSTSRKSEVFVKDLRYGKATDRQRQCGAKPGDLIEIFRGCYQHWAVYVGNNDVVHLSITGTGSSSSSSGPGRVTKENIWQVVGSSKFKVNNLLDGKYIPRDPQDIVKEACDMVGQPVSYSVLSNNCEHFATARRYGKAESRQVQRSGTKV